MAKVVATDSGDLLRPAIETITAAGEQIDVLPDGLLGPDAAERVGDAEVLLVGLMHWRRPALEKLTDVGLMIRCGIGVDVIDVDVATERGIWVANVPDYCVEEVADHTLLLLLAAARQMRHFEQSWREEGRWASLDYRPVGRLAGRTLGLIGLGRIGAEVARRARGFGLEVIASDPQVPQDRFEAAGVRRVEFDDLLAQSDIVSLHVPLTTDTRHILGAAAFAKMKDGVVVVNASRGGLLDLAALDAALESGKVRAAGLDVLEGEPTPDLAAPLLRRSNVVVTPHIAWYSQDARRELGVKAAQEALRYLRGERPRNLINPAARSAPGTAGAVR